MSITAAYTVYLGAQAREFEFKLAYKSLRALDRKMWELFGANALGVFQQSKGIIPADLLIWTVVHACSADYRRQHEKTLTDSTVEDWIGQMSMEQRAELGATIAKALLVANGMKPADVEEAMSEGDEQDPLAESSAGGESPED